MPVLDPAVIDQLIEQYLKTFEGQTKLVASMIDVATKEAERIRRGAEPDTVIIERLRTTSERLESRTLTLTVPPALAEAMEDLDSALHDFQRLPRPGRYRTLAAD